MSSIFRYSRYFFAVAALAALALAFASMGWLLYKSVRFVVDVVTEPSKDDALVTLFEAIDILLVATLLFVFSIGLWTLFVGQVEMPAWLEVKDLEDLEVRVASTLVLVLAVRFFEALVKQGSGEAIRDTAVAVAIVGALLLALVWTTHVLSRDH